MGQLTITILVPVKSLSAMGEFLGGIIRQKIYELVQKTNTDFPKSDVIVNIMDSVILETDCITIVAGQQETLEMFKKEFSGSYMFARSVTRALMKLVPNVTWFEVCYSGKELDGYNEQKNE